MALQTSYHWDIKSSTVIYGIGVLRKLFILMVIALDKKGQFYIFAHPKSPSFISLP